MYAICVTGIDKPGFVGFTSNQILVVGHDQAGLHVFQKLAEARWRERWDKGYICMVRFQAAPDRLHGPGSMPEDDRDRFWTGSNLGKNRMRQPVGGLVQRLVGNLLVE
jgi:hypothetical protein